ncbi:50S ribosomal protein L19 [bacterium]|nr:50S ribosomal protein L19 [bacterium]
MEERKNLGIKAGDTVRVHQKIQDKGKTRIQVFEGLVLARKHGSEPGATFTVRKVSSGIGVEKIYPLYSPNIDKIEIIKRAKVRRSKLYYIREKVNREIKRQMRRMHLLNLSTESEAEAATRKEAEAAEKAAAEAAEEVVVDTETEITPETDVVAEKAEEEIAEPKEEIATEEKDEADEVKEEEQTEASPEGVEVTKANETEEEIVEEIEKEEGKKE